VADTDRNPESWENLPAEHRAALEARLENGEQLIAVFVTDLDQRLRYRAETVVLTNRRVLGIPSQNLAEESMAIDSWELPRAQAFRIVEHGGLGALELLGGEGRFGVWRFTGNRTNSANRFVSRFRILDPRAAGSGESVLSVCPRCGGILGQDGECPGCATALQPPASKSLIRLMRFARQRAGAILLGFVLLMSSIAAGLVPPYLVGPLYKNVLQPLQEGQAVPAGLPTTYLGLLLATAILAWLLGWARNYLLGKVSEQISADLRNESYAHLQKLSLEFFGGQRTGDLISRISSDTDRICGFLSTDALEFFADAVIVVLTAVILFSINAWLAAVTLVPLLPVAWLVQKVRARVRHGYARGMTAWSDMVSVLADTIPGIRVVKAFAQEQREIDRFQRSNSHVLDLNNRVNRWWAFFRATVPFFTECGVLIVYGMGIWLVLGKKIEVDVILQFLLYIGILYVRFESMSRITAAAQRAAASAHRIFDILDRVPSVPEPVRPIQPGVVRGEIELRDVRFRYGKREVIHGINLKVQPGEMVGLVGPSGAGKSTLVNLVCRFYDVGEGAILVDGVDIRSFPVEAYRKNIGIVLQEPFLFFGTIAENIAYGRPNASHAEIVAAARAAYAHDFILRLPDGYDSLVGERGQALSGGERQRISIARALLTNPRILILDEATSSVDTETEREIQAALNTLVQGRTTLAIAHRLSTLRKANRLVVIESGKIVEMGTHEELFNNDGTYARLVHAQLEMSQQIGIG
jgi:ATP-binding cassette subfamily B protein